MTIVLGILRVMGILLLILLALAVIALLLPAGLRIQWRHGGELEAFLTVGPVRRRLFPLPQEAHRPAEGAGKAAPLHKERAAGGSPAGQPASAPRSGSCPRPTAAPSRAAGPGAAPAPKSRTTQRGGNGSSRPRADAAPSVPSMGDIDEMMDRLLDDPMHYVHILRRWGQGPGKFLLDRLRVRHVCIVGTVVGDNAAQTAILYGTIIAACNTAWSVLKDFLDVEADELRLEPDFTNEKAGLRCFACQITAKMYIIVATILLTVRRAANHRAAGKHKPTGR